MIKRCDYCDTRALSFVIVCGACGAPFPEPRFVGNVAIYDSKTIAMLDEWERERKRDQPYHCPPAFFISPYM